MRGELCWTRLLFLPWIWTFIWNTDTSLVLRSCPWLLVESNSPLSLPISFFLFLLNSTATRFPLLILKIYLSHESCPSLYPMFPSVLWSPNKIESLFQKEPLCGIETFQLGLSPLPPVIQLSDLHWDPLKTSCELCTNLLKFGLRYQKLFNHIHIRALSRISFPAADNRRKIRSGGFSGEVERCSSAWGFSNCCLWLFMSHCICIRTPVWTILTKAWLTIGHSASILSPKSSLSNNSFFSRPTTSWGRVPSPPRGYPQDPQNEAFKPRLTELHHRDPPSLSYKCDKLEPALSPHYQTAPKVKEGFCLSTCGYPTWNIPVPFSV